MKILNLWVKTLKQGNMDDLNILAVINIVFSERFLSSTTSATVRAVRKVHGQKMYIAIPTVHNQPHTKTEEPV